MKRLGVLIMLALALILAACSGGDQGGQSSDEATGGDDQEQIVLRLTTGLSPTDANTAAFTHPWMEMVEERTNGKVKFEPYFSQELVPMGEEINALRDGIVDVAGPVLPSYEPARYPLSDVTLLPLAYSNAKIASLAFADLVKSDVELKDGKTFVDFDYGQYNMKALPVQPIAEYTIGVVDHEFKTVDSLKNLRLRSSGRAHEIFITNLGSTPVSMPFSEEFEALSRGVIDGTVRAVSDYGPYGFDQLLTNALSGVYMGHFPFITLISMDKWESLPEDVRTVMEEAAYELAESDLKLEIQEESIEKAKEKGIKFTDFSELDPEAQALIEEAAVKTWKEWIDSKEKEGAPGLAAARLWRDMIVKHGGKVYDSVEELLK